MSSKNWETVGRDLAASRLDIEADDARMACRSLRGKIVNGEEVTVQDMNRVFSEIKQLEWTLRAIEQTVPESDHRKFEEFLPKDVHQDLIQEHVVSEAGDE